MNDNFDRELATYHIEDEISKCEDVEEFKEQIIPILKTQQYQWMKKIQQILEENGQTKTKFAATCGVSRVTLDKWCKGSIPKNRETFLRIGMAAGYDREQMDQLLQRYGQYPALYAKSLEDCVCIFTLGQQYGEKVVDKYNTILNEIKENIIRDTSNDIENIDTEKFDEKLSTVKSTNELDQFIQENTVAFATAYHRFYAYIKMYLAQNYEEFSGTVFELAQGQGWSSSLKQSVSAIRQNKWYPTRNKIISLGLHLSMDREEIDEALELAHMEPLYPKNIFEGIIVFILEDASLNNMLDAEANDFDPDNLGTYAKAILGEIDVPEVEAFISELAEMDSDE